MIYIDRIEVVNMLAPYAGIYSFLFHQAILYLTMYVCWCNGIVSLGKRRKSHYVGHLKLDWSKHL